MAAAIALVFAFASVGCAAMPTADWPPPASAAATNRSMAGDVGLSSSPGQGVLRAALASSWQGVSASGYPTLSLAAPATPSRGVAPPLSVPSVFAPALRRYVGGLPTTLPALAEAASSSGELGFVLGAPSRFSEPALVRRSPRLQCVPYARIVSGIEIYGNANTWWRQAEGRFLRNSEPGIGAVIAMRGYRNPNRGHVAVVTGIRSKREILVDHANWLNRGEITISTPMLDVSEAGDWSRVRVWHIPSGKWGARIYSVHGFIHQG